MYSSCTNRKQANALVDTIGVELSPSVIYQSVTAGLGVTRPELTRAYR